MKRILNNYEQWEVYYTDVILNTDNNEDVIEIEMGGATSFLSLRRWNKKICNSINLFIESVLTTVIDPKAPLFWFLANIIKAIIILYRWTVSLLRIWSASNVILTLCWAGNEWTSTFKILSCTPVLFYLYLESSEFHSHELVFFIDQRLHIVYLHFVDDQPTS